MQNLRGMCSWWDFMNFYDVIQWNSMRCSEGAHSVIIWINHSILYITEDIPANEWREYSLQLPEGTSRIFVLGGTYSSIPGARIMVDNMCIKNGMCGEVDQTGCDVSIMRVCVFVWVCIGGSRGRARCTAPKGPDSLVSTYKNFETLPAQESTPPYEVQAPPTGNPGVDVCMHVQERHVWWGGPVRVRCIMCVCTCTYRGLIVRALGAEC